MFPALHLLSKVSEIEVQASRASSLMADLNRIVPDVELAMGPLLKVGGGEGVVPPTTFRCLSGLRNYFSNSSLW